MAYNIKINALPMVGKLAGIEQGNPVRHWTSPTLHGATAIANAFRMGAGLCMMRGARAIKPGQCYMHGIPGEPCIIEIQRLNGQKYKIIGD